MLALAGILFLLSILIVLFAGVVLAVKLAIYALVAYAIYKLIEWIFS